LNNLDGANGKAAWQWLYIIEGCLTIFVGFIVILVLPDFPSTWKRLSPSERHVAQKRLALDAAMVDEEEVNNWRTQLTGFNMAMKDPKVHVQAFMEHLSLGFCAFQFFLPTLTATLGYNHTVSLLLVAPPYIWLAIWAVAHSYASDKLQSRAWFIVYPIFFAVIGCAIFMSTTIFGPRYLSLFLCLMMFGSVITMQAWMPATVPRPPAKRAAAQAYQNVIGNAASIWAPYMYTTGPYYYIAFSVNIAMGILLAIITVGLRFYIKRENKRLERLEDESVPLSAKDYAILKRTAEIERVDIATARELQKGFRYLL